MLMSDKTGLGKETLFNLKYIPSYSRTTRLGKRRALKPEEKGLETIGKAGIVLIIFAVTFIGCSVIVSSWLLRLSKPLLWTMHTKTIEQLH